MIVRLGSIEILAKIGPLSGIRSHLRLCQPPDPGSGWSLHLSLDSGCGCVPPLVTRPLAVGVSLHWSGVYMLGGLFLTSHSVPFSLPPVVLVLCHLFVSRVVECVASVKVG